MKLPSLVPNASPTAALKPTEIVALPTSNGAVFGIMNPSPEPNWTKSSSGHTAMPTSATGHNDREDGYGLNGNVDEDEVEPLHAEVGDDAASATRGMGFRLPVVGDDAQIPDHALKRPG